MRGGMPWCLRDDLRRFRELTMGRTVVMGRRTWEGVGKELDGRRVIVLSRKGLVEDGMETARSLEEAFQMADGDEVFIAGGVEVYREALRVADRMYVTWVAGEWEGDTFFPDVDWAQWEVVERDPRDGFEFVLYRRREPRALSQ